jgi:hypothetical protein
VKITKNSLETISVKIACGSHNSNSNSEFELSTAFAGSAADDVNIAIEELGKEIDVMSDGKKRKMKKTKKNNKKSRKH